MEGRAGRVSDRTVTFRGVWPILLLVLVGFVVLWWQGRRMTAAQVEALRRLTIAEEQTTRLEGALSETHAVVTVQAKEIARLASTASAAEGRAARQGAVIDSLLRDTTSAAPVTPSDSAAFWHGLYDRRTVQVEELTVAVQAERAARLLAEGGRDRALALADSAVLALRVTTKLAADIRDLNKCQYLPGVRCLSRNETALLTLGAVFVASRLHGSVK